MMKIEIKTMTTTATKTLRELLESLRGYATYTATLGTNGNGGMLVNVDDILDADEQDQHLDDYECAGLGYAQIKHELVGHIKDAGGDLKDAAKGNKWVAYDCRHQCKQGYLTGSISRIYVNLAI